MTERLVQRAISERAASVLLQARKNLVEREDYLRRVPVYLIDEVTYARGLLNAKQVFEVEVGEEFRFIPAFQIDENGIPKPQIAGILQKLEAIGMKGWEIAFWFDTENEGLDIRKPSEVLDDDPASVIAAAVSEAEIPQ